MRLRLLWLVWLAWFGLLAACSEQQPAGVAQTATGGSGNSAGSVGSGGLGGGGTSGATAGAAGVASGEYCAVWENRLRECGLIGAGRYEGCTNHGDPAEACEVQCISTAACAAISDFFCGTGDEIFDCQGACIGETPVLCGDGTRFSFDYRCDGYDDCPAREDETGCSATNTVKCRNVDQRVPDDAVCDGNRDCADGSDEPAGCSAVFTCADATELPAMYACDGFVDCPDGSDEPSDCARASCG